MNNGANIETTRRKSLLERLLLLVPIGNGTVEEAVLLWLMISVWMHYVVSGAMMVLLLFVVLAIPKTRKMILGERKMFFLGIIIAAFSLLSSLISWNTIGMAISFGVFMIVTLGCFSKSAMTEKSFQKLQVIWCIGSVISAVVGVYQNFFMYDNPLFRPTAAAYNANYYGALIVMTLIICIYNVLDGKAPEEKRKWYEPHKLFFVAIFLINAFMLLVCESRSSLLAILVCAIFYLFITKRYILFVLAGCLAAGVVAVGWFFPDILSWTNSLAFSFTERADIWMAALKSFSQNPYTVLIGRGPMTYYHVKETEGLMNAHHAHNLFFDTLLNVGVIGTVLYLLLFAYLIKEIFLAGKSGNKYAFVLGIIFILEVIVQGIADVTIMWHQSALLFMLTVALVGKENRAEK